MIQAFLGSLSIIGVVVVWLALSSNTVTKDFCKDLVSNPGSGKFPYSSGEPVGFLQALWLPRI